ncbi:MAG: alkaline phosphatase family protein [Clostridia bacterium]|nr:alkaline phosphatase family protein [Clostridia bacterium]
MNRHIYDRVYLIGVDGAGNFFKNAETPNIDRIFADGAYNHNVLTAYPTISAQCWGSMLHGVSPQAHRFTNGLVGTFPVPENHPYASVFKLARKAFPSAVLASISNWNPINTGIIEQGFDIVFGTGEDDEVCQKVCEVIAENDPKLLFVQLDSVDGAGHRYGYGTKDYLDAITHADALIGKIYDTAKKCGRLDNTLFLVTADHGGSPDGHHGGNTQAELIVSFFASGASVRRGEFGYMEIRDTASVIAFALGIEQPENWSARIPDGLFSDGVSFERPSEVSPDGSRRFTGRENKPTPDGKVLSKYIDTDTMRCYFPFDGDTTDKSGKCKTQTVGKLYFTEGFYSSAATLDDSFIKCEKINMGKNSFTFCCWLKLHETKKDEKWLIFSNNADGCGRGVSFYVLGEMLVTDICLGEQTIHYENSLPANYAGNLFHFICSYCRNDDELCYYYDFTLETDWYSEILIPKELELDGGSVRIGNCSPVTVDDLMLFDHKLSDTEIDNLERYYTEK